MTNRAGDIDDDVGQRKVFEGDGLALDTGDVGGAINECTALVEDIDDDGKLTLKNEIEGGIEQQDENGIEQMVEMEGKSAWKEKDGGWTSSGPLLIRTTRPI